MEEKEIKTIRTIGLIVSLFSGFIIFSNAMGLLSYSALSMGDEFEISEDVSWFSMEFLLGHYLEMCLVMISIGTFYLIGGIFLRKLKLWAAHLISLVSIALVLSIWTVMFSLYFMMDRMPEMYIFKAAAIVSTLFWTAPIVLLVWFVSKKSVRGILKEKQLG